uniref:Ornithine decarboxylase antizyme 2a n=1 Tax=Mastacembelus armatus TaxID=205130 RepID=A0A7N8XPB7_9TELE
KQKKKKTFSNAIGLSDLVTTLNTKSCLQSHRLTFTLACLLHYIKFIHMIAADERLTVTQVAPLSGNPSLLRFHYQLSERRSAFWDTALTQDSLFLEIPAGPVAEGSKEGLVALLEFAEEKLKMTYVFLWFRMNREDRCKMSIIKTFHYVGFEMVKPGNPMVPARPDLAFMVYSLDNSSSDEE